MGDPEIAELASSEDVVMLPPETIEAVEVAGQRGAR